MSTRTSFRYSNAFKQKVIGEIESGLVSIAEASKIYEISMVSLYKWIKSYGKDHLIGKVVMVQKRDEIDKIKKLEAEKRQLEAALAKSNLDKFCLECLIEAAEETYGISFKKNSGLRALKRDENE
jgi:transposase-like protein